MRTEKTKTYTTAFIAAKGRLLLPRSAELIKALLHADLKAKSNSIRGTNNLKKKEDYEDSNSKGVMIKTTDSLELVIPPEQYFKTSCLFSKL